MRTCEGGKEILTAEWEHITTRAENDFVCVYADGKLFRKDTYNKDESFAVSLADTRPSMRSGDDAIEMIAQFTFDQDLRNDAIGSSSSVTDDNFEYIVCDDSGGSCLNSKSRNSGYAWQDATEMTNSAIMSWVYLKAGANTATDIFYKTTSSNGNNEIVFQLELNDLKMTYTSQGGGTRTIVTHTITSSSSLQYTWHHVGLILNHQGGKTVDLYFDGSLVDSVDDSISWVATDIDASDMTATEKILFTSTTIDGERSFIYDDFRVYKGVVTGKHIEAIYSCSRSQMCASLAHTKPQSRRTYCLLLTLGGLQAGVDRPCVTGLYYNGLAVDLKVSMSTKGAMFTFRDTELLETGFEVLRQKMINGIGGGYSTVVIIDSELSGCATTFDSITFYDSSSITTPGEVWEYKVRTKYSETITANIDSDSYEFTTPWYGTLEGVVTAGDSEVWVPDVRVCARLNTSTTLDSTELGSFVDDAIVSTLSDYRFVVLSDSIFSIDAYKATDNDYQTVVTLSNNDYLKVNLDVFASITEVKVRLTSEFIGADAPIVRILDFDDPNDAGDTGSMCIYSSYDTSGSGDPEHTYTCSGTDVTAFPGQYVTILNTAGANVDVSEVDVSGQQMACPYYGFSDDDGNFEIEIYESSGVSARKAKVAVHAFKTDVFDPEDVSVFTPMKEGSDDSITIKSPEAVLIALEYDDTSSSSGSSSSPRLLSWARARGRIAITPKRIIKKKLG